MDWLRKWWYKLVHWEFWSFNAIYLPVLPYFFWLGAKARSIFFFNASNPTIYSGGMMMESKWSIYQQMPGYCYPKTVFVSIDDTTDAIRQKALEIGYPLIVKPDIGAKGRGVVLINNEAELTGYHNSIPVDYLLQQKVDWPLEIGVFYVRQPGHKRGRVTGIVEKKFPCIVGDGVHTVAEIVKAHQRYRLYTADISKQMGDAWNEVSAKGESIQLSQIGNHARGAIFYDVTDQHKNELEVFARFIDEQLPWFYFGRIDLRFGSWGALASLEDYSIIELNGAGSEPTHMYDPANSLFKAWREITRHWRWLYEISIRNHKAGHPYLSFAEGRNLMKANRQWEKKMEAYVAGEQQAVDASDFQVAEARV
jgi:hypothetical protein